MEIKTDQTKEQEKERNALSRIVKCAIPIKYTNHAMWLNKIPK